MHSEVVRMGDCIWYPYPRLRTKLFFLPLTNPIKLHSENMGLPPKNIGLPMKNFVKKMVFLVHHWRIPYFLFLSQTGSSINLPLKNSIGLQPGGAGRGVGGAKKVVSDSPGLVGLVNSVLNLPDGHVKYLDELNLHKNCEINSAHQRKWGASWNDVWVSKY